MNYSPGEKDPQALRQIADRMRGAYGVAYQNMTAVRNLVRFRIIEELKRLESQGIKPAVSSRPLAIVHQARAFLDDSIIKYENLPFDNSQAEDKLTSQNERWLSGVKPTYAELGQFPFANWIYDYFEVGRGILKLRFDLARAACREFPFVLTAVDPLNFARLEGSYGLVYAVETEVKDAAVLLDELEFQIRNVKQPTWKIPKWLELQAGKAPATNVELMYVHDRENCSTFITCGASEFDTENAKAGQLLYQYEHYMGRVPYLEAFCTATHTNRPEEEGFGMVFPILSMLKQENILFSKFAADAEIGTRPLAEYVDQAGHQVIEQVFSGWRSKHPVRPNTFKALVLQQNENMMDRLTMFAQNDVSRMSFPEITFGGQTFQQSGEAWRQVLSGLGAKIRQHGNQPQAVLGILAGWMLERVEYFITPAMARRFAPKSTDDWMESCSVGLGVSSSLTKQKGLLALTAKDIKGHYRVRATLEPNLPQDDTAKVTRFTQVRGAEYPFEQAVRDYLQPEHPEEVIEAYWREKLMREVPAYNDAVLKQRFIQELEHDPKLAQLVMQSAQMQMMQQAQQQQQQAMMPQGQGQVIDGQAQQVPPGGVGQGVPPPPGVPDVTPRALMAGQGM